MTEKQCACCHEVKPLEVFGRRGEHPSGRGPYCRICVNAKAAAYRAAKAKPPKEYHCRHCQSVFHPSHFNAAFCSDECRKVYQDASKKESGRAWYYANWHERRAKAKLWKKHNPDKCHQHRAKHYHAFKAEEKAAHDAWVVKNRARYAAMSRDFHRRIAAVREGKAAYPGEAFVLIKSKAGQHGAYWRTSAVVDGVVVQRPGLTEQIIARYEWLSERWCVSAPAIAPPAAKVIAKRLATREKKRRRAEAA